MTGEERSDARAYLEAMFEKGDTVALLAVPRWTSTGVIQQIKVVEELVRPESVKQLEAWSAGGYDVYCTVNTVKPKAVGRTKADIASVRRLQLDLDEDGREGVARLRRDVDAGVVPTPAVIMQSSRDRYQVLWHASEGAWTPATAERMMTRLAGRYGGDHAVADVARVMRVPGFRNRKPARESWVVSWRQYAGRPVVPEEFERLPEVDRHPGRRAMSKQKMVGQRISRSERDWAWVRSSLRAGVDPEVLRRELERRRQDKPSPAYYAQRTVNRAVDSLEAERAR